jgi:sugar lactone lactonase YvrE
MRARVVVVILTSALLLAAGAAQAAVAVHPVVSFDPAAGEFPEGVAVDRQDNAYVSLTGPVNDVVRITPGGERSVIAHFDVGGFGPLGLAVGRHGHLFVAVASFDPTTRGVYEVRPDGSSERLSGTDDILFPNGVALGPHGEVYATDSIVGGVWRIPRDGTAELWSSDPLMQGDGSFGLGFPIGANGVSLARHHALVVSVTEASRLVRIPIGHDGAAGAPSVLAEDPQLYGSDGTAVDVFGRTYVAVNTQNVLLRLAPDGSITTLASATDGLDNPASLAFGTSRGDRRTLFATNFAAFSAAPDPGLVKAAVGAPGYRAG